MEGQAVGYIRDGGALIDTRHQCLPLSRFLMRNARTVRFEAGLRERMEQSAARHGTQGKRVRVWQLRPETDPIIKFASYGELIDHHGAIDRDDYHAVFDGDCGSDDPETVWQKVKNAPPPGYRGHRLTRSDVLELYGPAGSDFYYIDTQQLRPIDFDRREPGMGMAAPCGQ